MSNFMEKYAKEYFIKSAYCLCFFLNSLACISSEENEDNKIPKSTLHLQEMSITSSGDEKPQSPKDMETSSQGKEPSSPSDHNNTEEQEEHHGADPSNTLKTVPKLPQKRTLTQRSRSLSHIAGSLRPKTIKEPTIDEGTVNEGTIKIDGTDLKWDVSKIAFALTLMDFQSFQAITPDDIENPETSQRITEIGENTDKIVNWLALQILMQKTEQDRKRLIKIIFMIGHLEFMHRNYEGTMKIVSLFQKPSIYRLMLDRKVEANVKNVWKDIYLNDTHWRPISVLGNYNNNLQTYRTLLSEGQSCLPILAYVLRDSIHKVVSFEVAPSEVAIVENTSSTTQKPSYVLLKTLPFEIDDEHMKFLNFFSTTPPTPEDLLDELSCLRGNRGDNVIQRQPPPTNLRDWTASHLVYCLMNNKCKNRIEFFFDELKIWNGFQMVHYLESLKDLGNLGEKKNRKLLKNKLTVNTAVIKSILAGLDEYNKNKDLIF